MNDNPINNPLELLFRGIPAEYFALLEPALLAFVEHVRSGTITHEELADQMVRYVPQAAAASREVVLAKLRDKCPTQQDLLDFLMGGVGRFMLSGIIVAVATQKAREQAGDARPTTLH
jgi:hypothetical protein